MEGLTNAWKKSESVRMGSLSSSLIVPRRQSSFARPSKGGVEPYSVAWQRTVYTADPAGPASLPCLQGWFRVCVKLESRICCSHLGAEGQSAGLANGDGLKTGHPEPEGAFEGMEAPRCHQLDLLQAKSGGLSDSAEHCPLTLVS